MTKRRVLVKQLLAAGFVYEKGSNHDKYVKGSVTVTVGVIAKSLMRWPR